MRSFKILAFLISVLFVSSIFAEGAKPSYSFTQTKQQSLSPTEALQKLEMGNQRFLEGKGRDYKNSLLLQFAAQQGQFPFAFVFNCIDSRSISEVVFDQGVGHMFVGRMAGNVVDKDAYASMEYATKFVGSKIIVVMGHTACGAVEAACKNLQTGNLTSLLSKIRPAVLKTEEQLHSKNCDDPKLIDAIAKQNVLVQLNAIYQGSQIIRDLVDQKQIELVGAMQDLKTGQVSFFDRNGNALQGNGKSKN